MLDLEKALTSTDLETLNEIITLAEEKANSMYRHEQTRISLSEEIFFKFKEAFKVYTFLGHTSIYLCYVRDFVIKKCISI